MIKSLQAVILQIGGGVKAKYRSQIPGNRDGTDGAIAVERDDQNELHLNEEEIKYQRYLTTVIGKTL